MIGFLFSWRGWELCVLPTRAYGTLLPKMHFFVLIFVHSNFSASFFLSFRIYFLSSALENIRHILSCRLFLYKAASLYACYSPNNYVTTKLFVIVHVCQYFCRAFFPIMSISICIITNKCVYNCILFLIYLFAIVSCNR